MKSGKNMIYAPVIIPTLCRDVHFVRCMESLKKNPWAKYTELFIGLDYPAKDSHWDGYRKISAYLDQPHPEFRAVHVFRRSENVGAGINSSLLWDKALCQFDRCIYMEDDLEVSPNFLEYMDKALMEYEDDPSVVMVTGYSYPLDWAAADGCTVVKQNFNASAWGRGAWRSKLIPVSRYLHRNGLCKDFSHAYRSGCFSNMLDFAVTDYVNLCEGGWSGKHGFLNSATDIAMRIYLAVKGQYVVMPLVSKVRNHGYDGSGLYCQQIEGSQDSLQGNCAAHYRFSAQPIDEGNSFSLVEDKEFDLPKNRDLLNRFDCVPPDEMEQVWIRAKRIARRGRYGGSLPVYKKALRKILRWRK